MKSFIENAYSSGNFQFAFGFIWKNHFYFSTFICRLSRQTKRHLPRIALIALAITMRTKVLKVEY